MLSYETQLDLKQTVVVKAYRNFSGAFLISSPTSFAEIYADIPDSSMPPILGTVASPLQYGYRTKITPHFDAPPKRFQKTGPPATVEAENVTQPEWLKIGFNHVGQRNVMDIEVGVHFCQWIRTLRCAELRIVQSPRLC